jgi:hypothetical protein
MGVWLEPDVNLVKHGLQLANTSPFESKIDKSTISKKYDEGFKIAKEKFLDNKDLYTQLEVAGVDFEGGMDPMLLFQFIIMDNSGLSTTEFRAAMSTHGLHETEEFKAKIGAIAEKYFK